MEGSLVPSLLGERSIPRSCSTLYALLLDLMSSASSGKAPVQKRIDAGWPWLISLWSTNGEDCGHCCGRCSWAWLCGDLPAICSVFKEGQRCPSTNPTGNHIAFSANLEENHTVVDPFNFSIPVSSLGLVSENLGSFINPFNFFNYAFDLQPMNSFRNSLTYSNPIGNEVALAANQREKHTFINPFIFSNHKFIDYHQAINSSVNGSS